MTVKRTFSAWILACTVTVVGLIMAGAGQTARAQTLVDNEDADEDEEGEKEGFSQSNDTILGYVGNNGVTERETVLGEDDNRAIFLNGTTLSWRRGTFSAGTRLDLRMYPFSPSTVSDLSMPLHAQESRYRFDNDVRLNRVWMRYRTESVQVQMGDFPLTIGKGIAFAVGTDVHRRLDMSLRGAGLSVEKAGRLRVAGYVGGINDTNLDPVTQTVLDADVGDTAAAAMVRLQLLEAIRLGLHGVHVEPRFDSVQDMDEDNLWVDMGPGIRTSTVGATAALQLGGVSAYLEGNLQTHDNYRVVTGEPVTNEIGAAAYSELLWDSGPYLRRAKLTLTAEGIYYRRFLAEGTYRSAYGAESLSSPVPYHRMPTLEPDWVTLHSLGNAFGGRVSASWLIKRTFTRLTVSSNLIQYGGGVGTDGRWSEFSDVRAVHPLFTLEQTGRRSRGTLTLTAGGRYETTDAPTSGYAANGYLVHGGVDGMLPLNRGQSLTLSTMMQRHRLGVMESNDRFWVSDNSVGYAFSARWRILFWLQYSNELQGTEKNTRHLAGWKMTSLNWFPAAEIEYAGPAGVFESLTITLRAGAFRGGEECFQGICREFPDSTSAFLRVNYRR